VYSAGRGPRLHAYAHVGDRVDLNSVCVPVEKSGVGTSYCAEAEREQALGVVGLTGAGRARTLVLNGHVGVVLQLFASRAQSR